MKSSPKKWAKYIGCGPHTYLLDLKQILSNIYADFNISDKYAILIYCNEAISKCF